MSLQKTTYSLSQTVCRFWKYTLMYHRCTRWQMLHNENPLCDRASGVFIVQAIREEMKGKFIIQIASVLHVSCKKLCVKAWK
ncbi:hypothetical protein [Sphingobacterium lumbrici]|uniref:hypothetical protein n=1 Tax=Sphingobacterium lumbrici TaxID=2559600 RepID=UPI00112925E6|nr:hypothetical protein [Sphingobacterium lumbrici]